MTAFVFRDWLILLSIMFARSTHVAACAKTSFLVVCIRRISFTRLSTDGHWGRFCLLALVSSAAMNVGVQMSLRDPAFNSFGYRPRSGLAGR